MYVCPKTGRSWGSRSLLLMSPQGPAMFDSPAEVLPSDALILFGATGDLAHKKIYPALYARAFYEGMNAAGQENVINLLRCAWAGSQKYGALVWSGDIDVTFRSMRNQFAAGLNMGLAGTPVPCSPARRRRAQSPVRNGRAATCSGSGRSW